VKFSELIAKARLKFDPPLRGDGKPHLQLVSTEGDRSSESDKDE
jgi:hypothetical protein